MRWQIVAAMGLFASVPVAAQPAPAPPAAERVRQAAAALAEVDEPRILREPEYAGTIADHLLVLQAAPGNDAQRRAWLDRILVYVLAVAGRHDQAEAAADVVLRTQSANPAIWEYALFAARRAKKWPRAATLVERALAGLPAEGWQAVLSPSGIASLLRDMRVDGDRATPPRIAEVLLGAGWPGGAAAPSSSDWLRELVIERALERGDIDAARRSAAQVAGLDTVLRLVRNRRFDLLHEGADRNALVRAAIDREDRSTAERLAAAPEETERLVARVGFLRGIGRNREVLDLTLPLMGEVRIVATRHERAPWLVNEAAFALIATGAAGEAAELMRPLFAMDIEANSELVNTSINFVSILWQAGQSEEALQRADMFMAESADFASDYGEMWVAANAVCAATDLRRTAVAGSWLARAAPIAESNPSAMLQALLCREDYAAAERVLLAALNHENHRGSAILWLQDYEPQPQAARADRLRQAFRTLRERPAVAAAFARLGHRLRLPIPADTYGWY